MQKSYLWTSLQARLQLIQTIPGANFNWFFLPGGPGMGSESLASLTTLLKLPGSMWYLDLPGDGSNLTANDTKAFANWSEALVEAVSALENVILVAHSTGGMYALATPELENKLTGLVLMSSAPDSSWQQHFMKYVQSNPIAQAEKLNEAYAKKPNNDTLKKLTILSAPYLFTEKGLPEDLSFLENLPYNFRTCEWSALHFDSVYKAKWVPKKLPTLIFAGEKDYVTPLHLFTQSNDFQRENITIRAIEHAAHFPWIENPEQVVEVFNDYAQQLLNR
ncbi:alpha/beta fold hydrolase [Legionella gresilensis]|uniref:alpha/beta fold hydrolase n=1 Tax=Legionella gresilensis TaxID=91823 RepID=UPI0010412B30|nr:alpha/beta hydrolase [Legionella gresilensis]